jgi:hypothetical protein
MIFVEGVFPWDLYFYSPLSNEIDASYIWEWLNVAQRYIMPTQRRGTFCKYDLMLSVVVLLME